MTSVLDMSTSLLIPLRRLEKEIGHYLSPPGIVSSYCVPKRLFLVRFLLTTFMEFHLGITPWGQGWPFSSCPRRASLGGRTIKPQQLVPPGRAWGTELHLHPRTPSKKGFQRGARVGLARYRELLHGEKGWGSAPDLSETWGFSGDSAAWNLVSLDSVAQGLSCLVSFS